MIKQVIYTAEDGTVFDNREECVAYENKCHKEKTNAILNEAKNFDKILTKKYFPEMSENEEDYSIPLHLTIEWLQADIVSILTFAEDYEETKMGIINTIKTGEHGEEIINKLDFINILTEVNIRRDYASALRKVKYGSELSSTLHYAFGDSDIKKLALLHKAGKFRKKIEDLLDNCNFHSECSDFNERKYDKYIDDIA